MANVTTQTIEYVGRTRNAETSLKNLSRVQRDLIDEFRSGNKTYRETVNGLKQVARGYEDAEQGALSFRNALKAVKQEQRLANQTTRNEDRFDTTSRQVALAGDVQSNLGAVSGLLGSAGAGGAAQGVGIAGELIVLTEELPRLKEAIRGMPAAANAAGQALGLGGAGGLIGALGLTGIAVAAVGLAFKKFSDDAQRQAKQLQAVLDARRDVATDIANGLSTEEANDKLAELNRAREVELQLLEENKRAYDEEIVSRNALFETVLRFTAQEQTLADAINESEASITEYETAIKLLEEATTEGAFAAGDAAAAAEKAREAEEELAQAREEAGQQILEEAAFAGELVALQQASAEFNNEELATKRLSLEQTKAQTQAELALLEARSNGSEVVKDQIANLRTEIEQLDESIAFLDSAQAKQAAAANTAREAEEELRKEREKSARSTKATAQVESRPRRGFVLGSSVGGRARAVAQEAESGITSAYQDAFEERANLIRDYNEQETRIKQEALFAQKQDLEQFKFAQDRLLEQGDFTSAFNRQREKAFQQTQDRDRILFDQSQRRDDLFSQIDRIASALATKIQVELQPNAMFNTTVKNISVQASTINRSF